MRPILGTLLKLHLLLSFRSWKCDPIQQHILRSLLLGSTPPARRGKVNITMGVVIYPHSLTKYWEQEEKWGKRKLIAPLGLYIPNCEDCCKPVQTWPKRVLTGSKPVFLRNRNFQTVPLSEFVQFLSGLTEHGNLQRKNENKMTTERVGLRSYSSSLTYTVKYQL